MGTYLNVKRCKINKQSMNFYCTIKKNSVYYIAFFDYLYIIIYVGEKSILGYKAYMSELHIIIWIKAKFKKRG